MTISRKLKSLLILFIFSVGLVWPYPISFQAAPIFTDVDGHSYKTSIEFLYNRGVVEGYPDGSFGPDREVNRAEIMKIILGASTDEDIGHQLNCFPDVRGDWYAKYVCYAKENGIIAGYPDGKFKPAQSVNTAEALKMGIEAFPVTVPSASGDWYQKYINFSHNNNIFSKYNLSAAKNMTRGEMAFLIHQLMLDKEGTKKFTGIRDSSSAGCGNAKPSPTPTSSMISGVNRHYITVIPSKYDKDEPTKLVFAFHGRTNPNTELRSYLKVEEASNGDAIFIYPLGLPEAGPSRTWSDPGDKSYELRDFTLFDQLLEEFSNNYCIDLDHVYVVGYSLGAWFTNTLSCARGNVIRGIGSLGGGTTINNCTGPVAAMVWHNPKDRLAPFYTGEQARDQILEQNGCGQATKSVPPSKGSCVEYTECPADAPVIWCPHTNDIGWGTYYPHNWPKGTGESMWEFLDGLED